MSRFSDIDCSFKRLPPVYGYHSERIVTIEEALKPIQDQIPDLARCITMAKKHCHYPSEHGLSKDQSAAIYIYTMEGSHNALYRVLNKALRSENRQELKVWFPYLKLFDSALDLLPTVKEAVWRGVPLDVGKNFSKNQLITWWSINSCSSSLSVIKAFLGADKNSTLFLIEAINGKRISAYTAYPNEDEIILGVGTLFRVKCDSLKRENLSYVVHLIEIDNNDDDDDQINITSEQSISSMDISNNMTKWKQNGLTIAGGNGDGNQLNQLYGPHGIYIDNDDQSIYIADSLNHRIVKWKFGRKVGEIIAGGNGEGNQTNQLNCPTDLIIDKNSDSIIICDSENRRVVRWPCQNGTEGEIIISNIDCFGITIDNNDDIYISNCKKNEVRRWKIGDNQGIIVAGGYGKGDRLNQLYTPYYTFVDQDYSVYVADYGNNRVMKWLKNAKEGIIVAGGHDQGNKLTQLSCPYGVIVDHSSNVYVTDCANYRVIGWAPDSTEGSIVVGGNGSGEKSNQFNSLTGLSFDRQGNLYVVDHANHRVQKFDIISD